MNKQEQKQHLIDIMKSDEELGLYNTEVDNFEIIKPLLQFDSKDTYFFCQILQRKKDHKDGQKVNGTNNNSRLIKAYYIKSIEQLEFIEPEVKNLCRLFNARAGINLNKRSFEKTALQHLKLVTDNIINGNYDKVYKTYSSAAGKFSHDSNKKWIVDVDKDEMYLLKDIKRVIAVVEPYNDLNPTKILAEIPSKTGVHLITSPFNLQKFKLDFPSIQVNKNSPTNIFIP